MDTFPAKSEYHPINRFDMAELTMLFREDNLPDPLDPNSPIDNRTAVRMYMALARVPAAIRERIVEPWDSGFYKVSDGKSHPISWMKLPRRLRKLHFDKDIVSVRHDWDYYSGCCTQKEADEHYYRGQVALGMRPWTARLEWLALRTFGRRSWKRHARKRDSIPGYGTLEWALANREHV